MVSGINSLLNFAAAIILMKKPEPPKISEEEYLVNEREAPYKSEYFKGRVIPMEPDRGDKLQKFIRADSDPALIPPGVKISEEEYLKHERAAPYKSEYYKGEVSAMAGASDEHNDICSNLIGILNPHLKGKRCKIRGSDQRIYVLENTIYTYPDAVIVCGESAFADDERDTLLNPSVIFEVLSESTKNYDRSEKFELYRSIPSCTEYVLVSSEQVKVELYQKQENGNWMFSEYRDLKEHFPIIKIDYEMQLVDLYEGINFPVITST